jgi:CRP-like cAMP-binding protein/membrane protease YdiL (CAAX protease family)
MIDERQSELLAQNRLLNGLDEGQLAAFMQLVIVVEIKDPQSIIVREGEDSENFYVILAGEAEVLKREGRDGQDFPIATLGPGQHFGETALFDQIKRTATIRTRTPMLVAMLKTREIRESPHSHPWLAGFLLNLAREGTTRLDYQTNQTVEGLRAEVDGGKRGIALHRFLIFAMLGLSFYAITLAFSLRAASTAGVGRLLSNGLYVGLGVLLLWTMSQRTGSLRFFGLRVADDWRRELRESLIATACLIALATALKFALIRGVPAFRGFELFAVHGVMGFMGVAIGLAYVVFMVLQEVCVRGVLQSSLLEIFTGDPRRVTYSIVLSNALFAAFHAHVSPYLAIMVFVTGLVWGLLYARHRSLLGVSISHALLGLWALRVLGLGEIAAKF